VAAWDTSTDVPTRLVFFSHYTGLGGGETSLLGLLGGLDRTRFEPILVTPRKGRLGECARALGVPTHVVPYRGASIWFIPSLWAHLGGRLRIEACLRRLTPAAVHSDFHTLPYVVPACRALGIPVIFTCYGWWFRPRWWQRRFYRGGPRTVLAISEEVRRRFLGEPPFMTPERISVLHLGVDTRVFHPRPTERDRVRGELGIPTDAAVVALVARFQSVKGHDVFLEAARRLASTHPSARFVLAGDNVFGIGADDRFMRRVRAIAGGDPLLRERVQFLGWVPRSEVLLAASDVVVCSSWFESFGMVPVEAMASGVPVVSTNVGGPTETIVDGETGYLVPPGRPDELARRVGQLLDDELLRRRMGEAGRRRMVERFSLARYVAGFSGAVDAAIAACRGEGAGAARREWTS
jgi:glycosyltransferase involved in cell wall biosynthesis